uniref:Uncharacterized protein n=1 Tax=Panagrolaimus davidi TaxID=227884 RepID=A0A914PWP7_9BILA
MKAEYETEAKKYGKKFLVAWTEPFEFESSECWDDVYDREKNANPNSAYISPIPTPMEPTGNFYDNIIPQEFSLPKPLIRYILDCTNDILLRKLHQTCKYIFLQKPTPICYSIEVPTETTSFINEALLLNNIEHPPINNYLLTTSLFARNFGNILYNPFFLSSTIIPSLSQCIAKYIKIGYQKLTFNELKFFIGSGNVELLEIFGSKITDGNNGNLPLEDIFKSVPKIRHFQMTETKCTPKTAEILANLNFQNKIKSLELIELYGAPLSVQAFKEFCIKNMDKTFGLTLDFQENSVTDEFCLSFNEAMKDKKYFSEKSIHRMEINIANIHID